MWLDRYRGLLCDLDGCLVVGGKPLPGARELVAYARDRWSLSRTTRPTRRRRLRRNLRGWFADRPGADRSCRCHRGGVFRRDGAGGAGCDLRGAGDRPLCKIARLGGRSWPAGFCTADARPPFLLRPLAQACPPDRTRRRSGRLKLGYFASRPRSSRVLETGVLLAAVKACLPGIKYKAIGKPLPRSTKPPWGDFREPRRASAIGDNPGHRPGRCAPIPLACLLVGCDPARTFKTWPS